MRWRTALAVAFGGVVLAAGCAGGGGGAGGDGGDAPALVPFVDLPVDASESGPGSPSPDLLLPLEVALVNVPTEVRQGDDVMFVVELHNPTGEDLPLEPCPYYFTSFGHAGFAFFNESYLNCDEAPETVPAGGSVSFEMVIELPDLAFGPGFEVDLFWRLRADNAHAPSSVAHAIPMRDA